MYILIIVPVEIRGSPPLSIIFEVRYVLMSLTKKRKKILEERKKLNPDGKCIKCGKDISKSKHHFYCDECHWGDWE